MNRGSVLVYILVLTIAMTTLVLSIISLATFHFSQVVHEEQQARAQYALEGAVNQSRYELSKATITVPATPTYSVGSWSVDVAVSDNSASLANTLAVTETASRWGRSFTVSRIIGNLAPPDKTWWFFALSMNTSSTFGGYFTTHGASSSVFSNSTFTVTSNSTISKDLYTVGSTKPTKVTVTGTYFGSTGSKIWFAPKATDYSAAANITLSGNQSFTSGASFPSAYYVAYVNGDLHLGGTFSGTATAYVTGNVYIDSTMSYGNPATDKFCVITPGTLHLNSSAGHLVGYFYAGTGLAIDQSMTMDSGAIIAGSVSGTATKNLDATWDNSVQQNPGLGSSLHMPGFWP